MVHPRLRVPGQLRDRGRELSFHDVGEGYGFEHGTQVGADRDPDLLQVLGGAGVLDHLGPLAPDVGQRSLYGADDGGQRDLLGRHGEPVAARGTTPGTHEAGAFQVVEDVLHELLGDALGLGDPVPFYGAGPVGGGQRQLGGGPQSVVGLGGNLQASSHSSRDDPSQPQPSSFFFCPSRFGTWTNILATHYLSSSRRGNPPASRWMFYHAAHQMRHGSIQRPRPPSRLSLPP